jgi:hypothetical protein
MTYKACLLEEDITGERAYQRMGTCPAKGCGYYEPKDTTTEIIGDHLMPRQCCMCKNYGNHPGSPPPNPDN